MSCQKIRVPVRILNTGIARFLFYLFCICLSEEDPPEMDIFINNVVCSFSVRCHLNLKEIALYGSNVEYR